MHRREETAVSSTADGARGTEAVVTRCPMHGLLSSSSIAGVEARRFDNPRHEIFCAPQECSSCGSSLYGHTHPITRACGSVSPTRKKRVDHSPTDSVRPSWWNRLKVSSRTQSSDLPVLKAAERRSVRLDVPSRRFDTHEFTLVLGVITRLA